jgi:hypothetical protein
VCPVLTSLDRPFGSLIIDEVHQPLMVSSAWGRRFLAGDGLSSGGHQHDDGSDKKSDLLTEHNQPQNNASLGVTR